MTFSTNKSNNCKPNDITNQTSLTILVTVPRPPVPRPRQRACSLEPVRRKIQRNGCLQKKGYPKMDGENNGSNPIKMDVLRVPLFLEIQKKWKCKNRIPKGKRGRERKLHFITDSNGQKSYSTEAKSERRPIINIS